MLELTSDPTIIENVPRKSRVELATHELGVTTRIGQRGLCFESIYAVRDECVKARMRLAFMSKDERTAQCAKVSSTVTKFWILKLPLDSIISAMRILS